MYVIFWRKLTQYILLFPYPYLYLVSNGMYWYLVCSVEWVRRIHWRVYSVHALKLNLTHSHLTFYYSILHPVYIAIQRGIYMHSFGIYTNNELYEFGFFWENAMTLGYPPIQYLGPILLLICRCLRAANFRWDFRRKWGIVRNSLKIRLRLLGLC